MIVERIIVPELNKRGRFDDLLTQMKSETGKYNRLWYTLLNAAEEAKIALSSKTAGEIELRGPIEDDDGKTIDFFMEITRSELEAIIKDAVDATAELLKKILTRNSLIARDLKFVLMVGGSTYVPFVRKRVEELLGIPVNTSIDPTNAIVIGAAYYAATKAVKQDSTSGEKTAIPGELKIKVAYNRASQEKEELFSAKVEGDTIGLSYRIIGDDGAFDSGLKRLAARISEDLPLKQDAYNLFTFRVFDATNKVVPTVFNTIQIAHGKYSVAGQMLPEDLSLVKDDPAMKDTRLERVFARNSVLPSRTKKNVEVGKTIVKGSDDELRIIVVAGSSDNHSSTNKSVGVLLITGKQISRDLLRGTDIDLTFEISESQDLTVSAYVNGTGQEFSQVFDPKPRAVPVKTLVGEIQLLDTRLERELAEAEASENFVARDGLKNLQDQVQELVGEAALLSIVGESDVTDDRFKLDDKKRKLAQTLNQLTSGKKIDQAKIEYQTTKQETMALINDMGDDQERHQLSEFLAREHAVVSSSNAEKVQTATAALERLRFQVLARSPEFLVGMFRHLVERSASMNDRLQAKNFIENGKRHIAEESWDDLRQVNGRLLHLLPQPEQEAEEFRHFTGIL